LSDGKKFEYRRGNAKFHEKQEAFVEVRLQVAHEVFLVVPASFHVQLLGVRPALKQAATQAAGLDLDGTHKGDQRLAKFVDLRSRHEDTQDFDDHFLSTTTRDKQFLAYQPAPLVISIAPRHL